MAVYPRGERRTTLSAISFLSQHGRRCPASRHHRGSGKARETLCVYPVENKIAGLFLRAGVTRMIEAVDAVPYHLLVGYFPLLQTPSTKGR